VSKLASAPPDDDVVDIQPLDLGAGEVAPALTRRRSRRVVGLVLVTIGCLVAAFLVFEFALSYLTYDRSQTLLLRDLRALVASQEAVDVAWVPDPGQPVGVLSIPKIGLSTVMVEGTSAAMTEKGPGHLHGTPLPGRAGNAVVMGRRTTYGAPFGRLDELQIGDEIDVSTGAGQFTYLVAKVAVVRPGDADVVVGSTDSRLTLITSSPPYLATGRYVVTGALRGLPAEQPPGAPVLIAPTELGLSGETGSLGAVVVLGELAVIAVLGAVWLSRRVSRRVGWLLGAPLVLALTWGAFAAASRFLPSTL
jgi:sortase A